MAACFGELPTAAAAAGAAGRRRRGGAPAPAGVDHPPLVAVGYSSGRVRCWDAGGVAVTGGGGLPTPLWESAGPCVAGAAAALTFCRKTSRFLVAGASGADADDGDGGRPAATALAATDGSVSAVRLGSRLASSGASAIAMLSSRSGGGAALLAGSRSGRLVVIDATSGSRAGPRLVGHAAPVAVASAGPAGARWAATAGEGERQVAVWWLGDEDRYDAGGDEGGGGTTPPTRGKGEGKKGGGKRPAACLLPLPAPAVALHVGADGNDDGDGDHEASCLVAALCEDGSAVLFRAVYVLGEGAAAVAVAQAIPAGREAGDVGGGRVRAVHRGNARGSQGGGGAAGRCCLAVGVDVAGLVVAHGPPLRPAVARVAAAAPGAPTTVSKLGATAAAAGTAADGAGVRLSKSRGTVPMAMVGEDSAVEVRCPRGGGRTDNDGDAAMDGSDDGEGAAAPGGWQAGSDDNSDDGVPADGPTMAERVAALEAAIAGGGGAPGAAAAAAVRDPPAALAAGQVAGDAVRAALRADSLGSLLPQALRAGDAALVERCLAVSQRRVVARSVARLLPGDASLLVIAASARLRARPGRAHGLVPWLRAAILLHSSTLQHDAAALAALAALHRHVEARTSSHRALLALRGRLDLINAAAGLGLGDSGDEDEAGDWRKPGVEVDEAGDRALAWAEAALGTKVGMGDSGSDDTGADGDSDSGSDGLGGEEGGVDSDDDDDE